MDPLRELLIAHQPLALALGGLVLGFLFGALTYRTNFCTMGAISDMTTFGDRRRFRAWMLAAATALVGTQGLAAAGIVPLEQSMYLAPSLNWVGHVVGGLMFGFGMVFAGGCPSRNLARAGGGDLRALLTLIVLGIAAYMAMGGLLGPARAWLEGATALPLAELRIPTQSLGDVAAVLTGASPAAAKLASAALIAVAVFAYCFMDGRFASSPTHLWSGFGVGLIVVAGWALTGLAWDELADRPTAPISLTYVRPVGDTLEWLERMTALGLPGFGVATVFGALFGAFLAARLMGRFKLTSFTGPADTLRSLSGASLMGIGGVLALGCTIGQGITGVSTLAVGSFLTLAAIVVGGIAGVRALERWSSV
ncbi:MAG TPA: YeeE/YedE family protein [Hyphomicrobiaceae bacterium]|nr:YeeE/YedE family protein [Hyphomicrobiaceae bacterium]